MNHKPPVWADRFLSWYCNPEILEEIQGDAHELYFERCEREGKRKADLKYIWDVIRFFRWSNIKRQENQGANIRTVWNLNFRIAIRNAEKNKILFGIKTVGLSVSVAFALLLTAYVVNELTFDTFHDHHDRIYRISSRVSFQDHVTHYAVTPLPIGQTMLEDIPEIESYFRFMYEGSPVYYLGDNIFHNETTLAADSNFLRTLTFAFLQGDSHALDEPNKIVLTKSTATKFFGEKDPLGKTIRFGKEMLLEVAAVVDDIPSNSHLKFDALISWDTFNRDDDWGNLNAYTYIMLRPDANIETVKSKMPSVLETFHELVAREYNATYEPIFEKITAIHFSETLDEDIVEKHSRSYVLILVAVIGLFLATGLINYLNLTMAEVTANLKKLGILKIYGGSQGSHTKILFSETVFALLAVTPLVVFFMSVGWRYGHEYLAIDIDPSVLVNSIFYTVAAGFFTILVASSRLNSLVISRATKLVNTLKGTLSSKNSGTSIRRVLVASQLSFSIIMIAMIIIVVEQFHFIRDTDKGFDDKNTIVVKLRSSEHAHLEAFNEAVRHIKGVGKVDGSTYYPGIIETKYVFQVETEKGMEELLVPMMLCGYDYFDALNIKMARGRPFRTDGANDQQNAFIVNETAAKEFGWKDPIGKKIRGPVGGQDEAFREGEVIGVTQDFNFASLHFKIEPLIIFLSDENWGTQFIYVKTDPMLSDDKTVIVAAIEKQFKSQWPEFPFEWEYLDSKYQSLYTKDYEVKNIFEIGLVISILISCLGIFSISALLVILRKKEMGIRKVVGASAFHLFYLHTRSFVQFLIISILVAWPVIWFLSHQWLQNFAYHIRLNAWYFIIPGAIALFITLFTSGYHGIKSALINPVDTLKHE